MRFLPDGPALPDDLLNARDQGQVIFFCGAGVSRAKADLPDFYSPFLKSRAPSATSRPNPAQSGPVLATVKTASRAPSAVACAALRPVLTAAARGAPPNPGRDGETVLRSNKETDC